MALNKPSKKDVMGWTPQKLSDYLRRLNCTGCDKIVMKGNISGAEFMKMTSRDFQVFPLVFRSLLTKIQKDLNMEEQKMVFRPSLNAQKYAKQVFEQDNIHYQYDFSVHQNNKSDNDYEFPDHDAEDGYINPLTDPQTAKDSDKSNQGGHNACAYAVTKPNLHIDRSKKPGQPGQCLHNVLRSREGSAVKDSGSITSKFCQPTAPNPQNMPHRARKPIPPPMLPEPAKVSISIAGKSLDPCWYGGKITRHQAEIALKRVNKDGAFLVRDSSKGFAEHPYTLMLLKQGKIYNIKIRNQDNFFALGNGTSTMSFPGVKELITHHTNTPLLLIDATDRSYKWQNTCCLLYPAGL